MDYDLETQALLEALREAQQRQATPMQGVQTKQFGDVMHVAGPTTAGLLGDALSRGFGQVQEAQTRQRQRDLSAQQQQEHAALQQQLAGIRDEDPIAANQQRMQIAQQMSHLPMARGMAQELFKRGVAFPDKMAELKVRQEEVGQQNAMRLQEAARLQEERLQAQILRDRERAQDRQDLARLTASLRVGMGNANADLDRQIKEMRLDQMREGKPPTEAERVSAGYLGRMEAAEKDLTNSNPLDIARQKGLEVAPSLTNFVMTPQEQVTRQRQEDWVRAKLRKESGAVIAADEMAREIRTYFPQAGDSKEVVQSKAQSRAQALEQLRSSAGRAMPKEAAPVPPVGNELSADEQAELDRLRSKFGRK